MSPAEKWSTLFEICSKIAEKMGCRFQNQISTKSDSKMVPSKGAPGVPQGTQMVPKMTFRGPGAQRGFPRIPGGSQGAPGGVPGVAQGPHMDSKMKKHQPRVPTHAMPPTIRAARVLLSFQLFIRGVMCVRCDVSHCTLFIDTILRVNASVYSMLHTAWLID